jgi:octaprenyl-diphosphate synthase
MLASEIKSPVSEAANTDYPMVWKRFVAPVEPFLDAVSHRLMKQVGEFDASIEAYAEYALKGQGKQLRPLLVALSAGAAGKTGDDHVTVAVIIEMVHLATLVHDDVMDEAEIRRGRRTLAANWGNEIAVLAGDCLFAHALKLAASFPTPEVCRAVSSATNTVCTGEILQTRQRANFRLSLEEYFKILEMKTGELFALSCEMGAFLGDANPGLRASLRQFGMALGTAYQMYDDCVDIFGTETAAGKSLGTDLTKGKLTLPVLLLRERINSLEQAELQKLIQNWQPRSLVQLNALLTQHRILKESLEIINHHLDEARQIASGLSDGREALLQLTNFLGRQTEEICS